MKKKKKQYTARVTHSGIPATTYTVVLRREADDAIQFLSAATTIDWLKHSYRNRFSRRSLSGRDFGDDD